MLTLHKDIFVAKLWLVFIELLESFKASLAGHSPGLVSRHDR